MSLKIKQLNWEDNISEDGKKEGYFEIISDVIINGSAYIVGFIIRNFINGHPTKSNLKDKYFLWIKKGIFKEECIEFNSIEEAKEKAQKEYKKRIIELFFDGVDDEFAVEEFLSKNDEVKSKGIECFGDSKLLERWLLSSTIFSKGYLKNKYGRVMDMPIDVILDEIGRIEHGIF